MKQLLIVGVIMLVLASTISVSATSGAVSEKFLDGKSNKEKEEIISKLSVGPLYYFAKLYGIDSIQGKKLNFETDGSGSPSPKILFADRPVGTDPKLWENEPSIATKPNNANVVVAASHKYPYSTSPTIRCVAYRSSDGGETWSSSVQLPLLSNTICSDPVVRWAPDSSKVYAAYMSYSGTNSYVVVSKSIDNGATWSSPVIALTAPAGELMDKPWLDVHTFWNNLDTANKVYISATRFGSSTQSIVFTRSTNGASSFSPYSSLVTTNYNPTVQGSRPIGGKSFSSTSGDVLVCWYDSQGDGWLTGVFDIKCRTSTNYGSSFGSTTTAANDKAYELEYYLAGPTDPSDIEYHRWWGGMFPSIIITYDGVAHIVFTADPIDAKDYWGEAGDIFYTKAPRPYTTWTSSARERVNENTWQAQGYATITAKRVSGGSILTAFWEDHRNSPYLTPSNEDCGYGLGQGKGYNCYYDIYMTSTSPGGVDWNANPSKRVTDASSMSEYFGFIGDYIDSSTSKISSDTTAHVVWTDKSDVTSVFNADDDIYADRVQTRN
jgi:hypothetical protein